RSQKMLLSPILLICTVQLLVVLRLLIYAFRTWHAFKHLQAAVQNYDNAWFCKQLRFSTATDPEAIYSSNDSHEVRILKSEFIAARNEGRGLPLMFIAIEIVAFLAVVPVALIERFVRWQYYDVVLHGSSAIWSEGVGL